MQFKICSEAGGDAVLTHIISNAQAKVVLFIGLRQRGRLVQIIASLAVAITIIAMAGCRQGQLTASPLSSQHCISTTADARIVIIQYGYKSDDSIGYIAFTTAEDHHQYLTGIVTAGTSNTYLTKPNNQRLFLPSDAVLFECNDGQYSESNELVERKVFETFLSSKPKEYTIDALLKFVRKNAEE